jgi:Domain of unknown function (DUF4372)
MMRNMTTKRHLITLLYGQFSGTTSLREIVTGLETTRHGFTTWVLLR